jgi:hypothetical protein
MFSQIALHYRYFKGDAWVEFVFRKLGRLYTELILLHKFRYAWLTKNFMRVME